MEKISVAQAMGGKFVSINTDVPDFVSIEEQQHITRTLAFAYPEMVRYIATFDFKGFPSPEWLDRTIYNIQSAVNEGAAGIKIWKNLGMDLRDESGNFVMIDDDRLDPVFDYLETHQILVLGHQGEPRNCWLPLEQMTVNSDRNYFKNHPEYHMFLHPEFPSYEKQIDARDNRLQKNPKLRFVGLHLMSLEYSIEEVARRLDRFPNAMTDLAERICHLQLQARENRESVRDFMIKYQDRIIYGTDVIDDGSDPGIAARFGDLWKRHWNFFASSEWQDAPEFDGDFQGLDLPEKVLSKLFYENAARAYGF
ncbi:amidohydrolase family protein [Fulvivirga sedimenti]|uniref:Amidohydrolase n=1 Tax=Fulvivirga sedimenti TaxID=2879465 RepID=A0A9X1HTR7_9BACT|nr:amidohydrolase [Fulvivirga sedimenti]MCA6076012.1 amidohydrolase [Fulvivirga sedimenti]MCA6077140.1 amidohydrolase [Fulvivirga sedimenti]